ncbi:hypothetical protein EQM13_00980 [Acidilutibacter cellobiosedens]|uniref:Polyhydroxyalkanoate synthesis regulator phasin n=1 Tax=Acidilutibacter cellobiosedens TaxID=2507161 RepID=A0A410Q8E8_9FIRM|nr:hypothetical protein EQM13_00980 [Acidilutibacter cellobiosedens]
MKVEISLKNLLLAGIGSIAVSYEKGTEMIENLVKKGELTITQGKELNEELKKTVDTYKKDNFNKNIDKETLKSALSELNLPTKQDIEELKQRIDNIEKNN